MTSTSSGRRWVLAAGLLAAAAAATWLVIDGPIEAPREAPAVVQAPQAARGEAPQFVAPSSTTPTALAPEAGAPGADAVSASTAPDAAARVTWRGRALDPAGHPVAGVPWRLQARGDDAAAAQAGEEAPVVTTTGVTDAEGRFAALFASPPAQSATFKLLPEGGVRWVAYDHAPFAPRDLDFGDALAGEGTRLAGEIVDGSGRLVPGAWSISISPTGEAPGCHLRPMIAVPGEASDGRFELSGLPPGEYEVRATLRFGPPPMEDEDSLWRGSSKLTIPQGASGGTTAMRLVYDGEDLSRLVLVVLSAGEGRPAPGVDPEAVTLRGGAFGAEGRHPDRGDESGFRPWKRDVLRFHDVPPGAYALEVLDPAYLPWRRDGVQPGATPVQVELLGSNAVTLLVSDALSGQPIESFTATAAPVRRSADVETTGTPVEVSSQETHAGGVLLIDGLPTDIGLRFEVQAAGHVPFAGFWDGAQPETPRHFAAVLQPTGGVSGRVLLPDGSPAARVQVGLFSADAGSPPFFVSDRDNWRLDLSYDGASTQFSSASTDADGRFQLSAGGASRCFVRAWRSPVVDTFQELSLATGEARQGIELVLPSGVDLAARLVDGAGPPGTPWAVALVPVDAALAARTLPVTAAVAADGAWRAQQLLPGAWEVFAYPVGAWEADWLPLRAWHDASEEHVGRFDMVQWAKGAPCAWLGRVDVPAAAGTPSFDVAATRPARVQVRVLAAGAPVVGAHVALSHDGDSGQGIYSQFVTDAEGLAVLEPLLPGGCILTTAEPADGPWSFVAESRHLTLRPGDDLVLDVVLDLRAGSLLCLDASDGQPLADKVVALWRHDGETWRPRIVRTDTAGRVALTLPPVELRVARVGRKGDDWGRPVDPSSPQDFMRNMMQQTKWSFPGGLDAELARAVRVDWVAPETVLRLGAPLD